MLTALAVTINSLFPLADSTIQDVGLLMCRRFLTGS